MTARERWLALFRGQRPDRAPCDYWGTAEVTARLKRDLGCASDRELWRRLRIDKCIHLAPRHPRATEDTWHLQSLFSIWGIGTANIEYGDGIGVYEEAVVHPLAGAECVADVESFLWPDPDEWDVSGLRAECDEWREYPILCGSSEPFYLYSRLRGMELALEDLIERPEMAEAALERIYRLDAALIRRILDAAGDRIDLVYIAEDLGTQNSLLMSPALWRRFLKPRMAALCELVHGYGARVFHHDDGAIRPLIPELIEAGIDILNPIQWRCRNMDRAALAADFGARVIFHGGVDNQETLPFGTADQVREQVRENLRLFNGGRGYIVAPCHNVQANTPTENIAALYEAVASYCSASTSAR